MAENICKECGGEVEVGEICSFCGAMADGVENCGTNPMNIRQHIKPGNHRGHVIDYSNTDPGSITSFLNPINKR